MKLRDWKEKYRYRNVDLAGLFDVSMNTISNWLQEKKRPSVDMAAEISFQSRGEVTVFELLFPDLNAYKGGIDKVLENQSPREFKRIILKGKEEMVRISFGNNLGIGFESDFLKELERKRKGGFLNF